MKKEEFIKLLNHFDFPKTEYYVLSGGSMLLHGLREETEDIDLCVSKELFEQLRKTYPILKKEKEACITYSISDNIEVKPEKKQNFNRIYIEGYPVETLESVLVFKEKRNLPKDKKDIDRIKQYLLKK